MDTDVISQSLSPFDPLAQLVFLSSHAENIIEGLLEFEPFLTNASLDPLAQLC